MSEFDSDRANGAHVLIFPFPAQGHMIPILDLTHILVTRGLTATVLVSPSQLPLLEPLLSRHPSSAVKTLVLSLPDEPSTNSTSPITIMRRLHRLYDPILQWFRSHPSPPVAIISDIFLGWTHDLACDAGVRRVVFWASGAYAASTINYIWRELPKIDHIEDKNTFFHFPTVPNNPKYHLWQLTLYHQFEEGDPDWEFFRDGLMANVKSWGAVFNSFSELERVYLDHVIKEMGHHRVWAVGPVLPPEDDLGGPTKRGGPSSIPDGEVLNWLDEKPNGSVIYVCFGSRWALTEEQMSVLAAALECSGVHFILVLKEKDVGWIPDGYEDRVAGRGFLIKGWAPQVAVLRHRAVGAFVTHCGWNSVLEGIGAGVMLLAWPIGGDQIMNADLLVNQHGAAIGVCQVESQLIPESSELAHLFAEAVSGARPERGRVWELRDSALKAVKEGGSSSTDIDLFVKQLRELKVNEA